MPATEKARQGGSAYNNFDTNSGLMYTYSAVAAEDVPALVTGYYGAGRMNHGDFRYSFADNVGNDNTDSAYDATLGGMLDSYKTSLVSVYGDAEGGSGDNSGGDSGQGGGTGGDSGQGGGQTPAPEGTITCTFDKAGNPSNSFFTVVGNGSNSKGTATVDGTTYSECLKLEGSTSIKFTLPAKYKMTLYFGSQDTKYNIKIDGTKVTGANGILEATLEAGAHELTKADTGNLFYIKLVPAE